MRILFDQGTPRPLASSLTLHSVTYARDRGWERLSNGDLLAAAEREGFDVLLTTDRHLRYQQNLMDRRIAIIVLGTTRWPLIRQHLPYVVKLVDGCSASDYVEIELPTPPRTR